MSAWRRVRWNGRMTMRRRLDSSSITRLAGRLTIQRRAGTSSFSYAAHAAKNTRIASSQNGRAIASLIALFLPIP